MSSTLGKPNPLPPPTGFGENQEEDCVLQGGRIHLVSDNRLAQHNLQKRGVSF